MINKPPLWEFFLLVRQRGINLTPNHYYLMLEALEGGFGIENLAAFERLCSSLWIRSPEEKEIFLQCLKTYDFHSLRDEISQPESHTTPLMLSETKPETKPQGKTSQESRRETKNLMSDQGTISSTNNQSLSSEHISLKRLEALAIKQPRYTETFKKTPQSYRKLEIRDFPVTSRVLRQSLRCLADKIKSNSQELDIEATLKTQCRDGFIIQPLPKTEMVRRLKLLILVDESPSMRPFSPLIEHFLTILSEENQAEVLVYYFTTYPTDYLYAKNPQMTTKGIIQVWGEISPQNTVAIILSDGGAANREYSKKRFEKTKEFLNELNLKVKKAIWLNPTPTNRWSHTTAREIAGIVKMWELNDVGLRSLAKTR